MLRSLLFLLAAVVIFLFYAVVVANSARNVAESEAAECPSPQRGAHVAIVSGSVENDTEAVVLITFATPEEVERLQTTLGTRRLYLFDHHGRPYRER